MNVTKKPKAKPRSVLAEVDPRRAILAQWRGVDLEAEERSKAITARSAKALMPKVLAELGLDRRCAETEILKVWNHLLDPNIVAHAQPAGLRRGTLFVNVDSSVWLSELVRYRRQEILERLQHSFGKLLINRISFRIG
jgi:predicted nucleic acid-binding Zn ribbon protein